MRRVPYYTLAALCLATIGLSWLPIHNGLPFTLAIVVGFITSFLAWRCCGIRLSDRFLTGDWNTASWILKFWVPLLAIFSSGLAAANGPNDRPVSAMLMVAIGILFVRADHLVTHPRTRYSLRSR